MSVKSHLPSDRKQNTDMAHEVYLASKPRYEILDGLRGVASLLVIVFHLLETYSKGPAFQIINHGYLAVDFFFVLSGFVIGYAYDDRWDRMGTAAFFKRRLIRLHPMVMAGTAVGACLFFFSSCAVWPSIAETPLWNFLLCIILGLLMIPCWPGIDIRGWSETNPLNGPNWSLTYEYIGNILYALIFRKLPTVILAILCGLSAVLTLNLTLGWNLLGIFDGAPQYNVIGGWSLDGPQIFIGFTRLLYPFLCGLLISRILPRRMTSANPSGSPLHLKGGFWWCSLILAAVFAVPCIGGKQCPADGLYQAIAIIAVFPLTVLIGAGSRTTDPVSTKICKFLGDISYPLYITHFPLVCMQVAWVNNHPDVPMWMHVAVSAGVLILSVLAAYGWLRLYDEPVRKWLRKRWFA